MVKILLVSVAFIAIFWLTAGPVTSVPLTTEGRKEWTLNLVP